MRTVYLSILLLFVATHLFAQNNLSKFNKKSEELSAKVLFTENKGQVSDQFYQPRHDILFSGTTNGLQFFLRNDGVSYQQVRIDSWKEESGLVEIPGEEPMKVPSEITIQRTDINWVGINSDYEVQTAGRHKSYTNYYLASCPDGVTNVASFDEVRYNNVYDNIDVKWYENNSTLR